MVIIKIINNDTNNDDIIMIMMLMVMMVILLITTTTHINLSQITRFLFRSIQVHVVLQSGYAGCLARGPKKSSLVFFNLGVFMLETCQMINLNSFEASGIRIIFLRAHQVRDVEILDTGQLPLDGGLPKS